MDIQIQDIKGPTLVWAAQQAERFEDGAGVEYLAEFAGMDPARAFELLAGEAALCGSTRKGLFYVGRR